MKERPILFSTPMIRALLAGTKTQTRRIVKWRGLQSGLNLGFSGLQIERIGSKWALSSPTRTSHEYRSDPMPCPYGLPGDRLWVREAFRLCAEADATLPRDTDEAYRIWYEADAPHQPGFGKLRPGMFMPRWASRLTLEITGVRVERLNDISESDAQAEGIERVGGEFSCSPWRNYRIGKPGEMSCHCSAKARSYMTLWESISGPGSWTANPWVWVVEFRRVAEARAA